MAKTIILIDTENIGGEWTNNLCKLNKMDEVILFYTVNSRNFSIENLRNLVPYVDKIKFVFCEAGEAGRNALDFQLVTYLGFLLKNATKTRYIIYSRDTGYNPVVEFWKKRERNVLRMGDELLPEYRDEVLLISPSDDADDNFDDYDSYFTEDDFDVIPSTDILVDKTALNVVHPKAMSKAELKKARKQLLEKSFGKKISNEEYAKLGNIMTQSDKVDDEKLLKMCKKIFGDRANLIFNTVKAVKNEYLKLR